jgi:hypothetical protein
MLGVGNGVFPGKRPNLSLFLETPRFQGLAFTLLNVFHNSHFAGLFSFHFGNIVEFDFRRHSNMLLDLFFVGH